MEVLNEIAKMALRSCYNTSFLSISTFFYYQGEFIVKLINVILFAALFIFYRVIIGQRLQIE